MSEQLVYMICNHVLNLTVCQTVPLKKFTFYKLFEEKIISGNEIFLKNVKWLKKAIKVNFYNFLHSLN